jgi:hypothetical protein
VLTVISYRRRRFMLVVVWDEPEVKEVMVRVCSVLCYMRTAAITQPDPLIDSTMEVT